MGAHACTDVTGFGLAGHLAEMIRASGNVRVEIDLDALPVLSGADRVVRAGLCQFASVREPARASI